MKSHSQNGFTITELLITIALMAIIVPGLSGVFVALNNINDRAEQLADINVVVENKIEFLRSKHFSNLANGGPIDFTSELPPTVQTPRSATYTISTAQTNLKKVTVTVTYNDRGTQVTVPYTTYIGESGVGQ